MYRALLMLAYRNHRGKARSQLHSFSYRTTLVLVQYEYRTAYDGPVRSAVYDVPVHQCICTPSTTQEQCRGGNAATPKVPA